MQDYKRYIVVAEGEVSDCCEQFELLEAAQAKASEKARDEGAQLVLQVICGYEQQVAVTKPLRRRKG